MNSNGELPRFPPTLNPHGTLIAPTEKIHKQYLCLLSLLGHRMGDIIKVLNWRFETKLILIDARFSVSRTQQQWEYMEEVNDRELVWARSLGTDDSHVKSVMGHARRILSPARMVRAG